MKTFGVLKKAVLNWAEPKKLLGNKNKMTQGLKTLEEVTELLEAIQHRKPNDIKDALGDILVTVLIQCKKNELEPEECLEYVLYQNGDPLVKRTGVTKNGKFIKDS